MAGYVGAALALYGVGVLVKTALPSMPVVSFGINAVLFGAYLGMVYLLEKGLKVSG